MYSLSFNLDGSTNVSSVSSVSSLGALSVSTLLAGDSFGKILLSLMCLTAVSTDSLSLSTLLIVNWRVVDLLVDVGFVASCATGWSGGCSGCVAGGSGSLCDVD